jgi:hypothetical protein
MGGVAGHHRAAAREGADAPIELVSVAGYPVDVGDRDTDLVGDDLGEAGEMALALGADAGGEQHPAAALDLDSGALMGADAGAFDIEHHPDAHPPSLGAQLRLLLGDERTIADRIQGLVEHRAVIAAVVMQRREILVDDVVVVGERVGRDEVALANLGTVEPKLTRRDVQQPLDNEHPVLTPGAAIGRDDRKSGEDRGEPAFIGGHNVGPSKVHWLLSGTVSP